MTRTRIPLIFLHGFLGRGADWQPITAALPHSFNSFMPDLPGHGENRPALPEAPLQFSDIHKAILALIDSLPGGYLRPVLVGYSMGGRAALSFACAYPGRLSGLVLESADPGISDPAARQARAALDDARAARILAGGLPDFLKAWYAAALWDSLAAHPELKNALLSARAANDPAWMARVIADLSPGRSPNLWPCLASLSMPVLLLAGALDKKYARMSPQAADRIPGSSCVIIPEAGHNIHLERPEAFNAALSEFLSHIAPIDSA